MKQSQILIRYGEIGLKSDYTRLQFSRQLKKNIEYACTQEKIPFQLKITRGRFFLYTKEIEKASKILKKIFGIVSFSPVWESSSDLCILTSDVITLMSSHLNQKMSFALRIRRSGNHEYTSQDVAIKIGQAICDHFQSPVDLDQPDIELFIEIRNNNAFLFFEKIKSVGGLPYGTQGMICCPVRKPIDILAGWFLMKRGCSIRFFLIDKSLRNQIKRFLNDWYIKQNQSMIKKVLDKNDCSALCIGLTFHHDKKELIDEINRYKTQFSLPVLTPLIGMQKKQIKNNAEQVGIQL